LKDEARAIIHLIENTKAQGAYNLTAPQHATCTEIVRGLGKALGRPTLLQVPSFAMRLLIGEAAEELLLCNQKMTADKLLDTGFKFKHPTLQSAIDYVVAKNPAE
jgi:NAD dependent epimerase/dehydratase family enzyme